MENWVRLKSSVKVSLLDKTEDEWEIALYGTLEKKIIFLKLYKHFKSKYCKKGEIYK